MKKIEDKFGKDGAKLHKMQAKEFTNLCSSLFEQMRNGLNRTTGSALLKDYSPWLQNFQANQYYEAIEIPGTDNVVGNTADGTCRLCKCAKFGSYCSER